MEVPLADAVVETRLRSWAMGLMAEEEGAAPPQELVEQIDLLLGPLSKEDMIARLVARELGRLNLGHRADLNDRGPKNKGFKKDGQSFKGGTSAGGFKKPFKKGGYKKGGYKKDGFKKGGYKKGKPRGYEEARLGRRWIATGGGDWPPREGSGAARVRWRPRKADTRRASLGLRKALAAPKGRLQEAR